ncbi:hypothetical protein EMGBS15_06070 [Filimonas sp.]|nr:hypothetical protein EMGBS15_06070 [Filimonas sp.]
MKNHSVVLCHVYGLKNKSNNFLSSIPITKFLSTLCLLLAICAKLSAQTESDYEVVDKEEELKKICWPVVSTSETEATTNKLKTDIPPGAAPASGGLASFRSLLTAIEIPNSFPGPSASSPLTIEIYDLLGNPLIINGTQITFTLDTLAAHRADSILGTTNNYHWVGYKSTPFQPDNQGVYFYNIFHRWFTGMPSNYHNLADVNGTATIRVMPIIQILCLFPTRSVFLFFILLPAIILMMVYSKRMSTRSTIIPLPSMVKPPV